ncbi:hypothetical protein HYU13_01335 [Candidatus Woesearchaeota archaeon]|nr:hypothetical protein [Candidatus Woesearchaeota archaeon]
MGFLQNLFFWKKKDDFNFGDIGKDLDLGKGTDFGKGPDLGLGDIGKGFDPLGKNPGSDFGAGLGNDLALPGQEMGFGGHQQDFSQGPGFQQSYPGRPAPMQQPFGPPVQQQFQQGHQAPDLYGKDLEVVSAKLDSIRYTLESINQRLANLERIANGEYEQKRRW